MWYIKVMSAQSVRKILKDVMGGGATPSPPAFLLLSQLVATTSQLGVQTNCAFCHLQQEVAPWLELSRVGRMLGIKVKNNRYCAQCCAYMTSQNDPSRDKVLHLWVRRQ